MRKQFKKVALGVACAMAIAVTAPAAQTSYAGTTVYEVTLGTPERRAITEESLQVGETIDLNFYGVKDWTKNKDNYKCKWTASGDAVTVSNWGVVTAVKSGTAVITLTITDKVTGVSHNIAPTTITVAADAADFETVLRELHSIMYDIYDIIYTDDFGYAENADIMRTYREREAYIATLDPAKYAVVETDFSMITDDWTTAGYLANEVLYVAGLGEDAYEYSEVEAHLMTLKNLATGEMDPWGVKVDYVRYGRIEEVNEYYIASFVDKSTILDTQTMCYTIEEYIDETNDYGSDPAQHYISCEICNGEPECVDCASCEGTGFEPGETCKDCSGVGLTDCYSCDGSGIYNGNTCGNCNGTGSEECWSCDGTGRGGDYCEECGGNGYIRTCEACDGRVEYNPYAVVKSWDTLHYYEDIYTPETDFGW